MSALSNLLTENKGLMIAAAAVAFFVAAVLILLVFRLAFGRRLRMPGGRARQMRLGIVDAFDLDRQRQLVIVRRDNVEHLIMIGGPNDILIESQIVRTEARSREKEGREREPATHAPAQIKPPVIEPKLPIPPIVPELQPAAAAEEHAGPAPVTPLPGLAPLSPASRPPAAAPVPRRQVGPAQPPAPASKPSPAHEEAGEAELPAKPQALKPPAEPRQPRTFMRWPARTPASPGTLQPKRVEPPQAPTPQMPPAGPATIEPPAAGPPPPSLEGIESLEEEMAKLLGRGSSKP